MPTQLQYRGGTTTQHAAFTGANKEVTVNTTKKTLVVHDGTTAGGHELARADLSNVTLPADANTTYSISAETTTGGVNLRLTGSNASTDDVKLAAGTNITLTRTDASTITIDSAGGGGSGSGTVNTGAANALAYYPSAGTTVDDISAITWTPGTSTLAVAGTVTADTILSTGAGTPNFSSDTDLEVVTDANGTPQTFTFSLEGQLKFGTAPFRIIGTVPTSSVGVSGNRAGDVAMNGTSIFYCTANYDGTSNIWVKSAWTTTGAW